MPRRFIRHLLVLGVMLSSEVWALGLGEIRLNSALNQPLRVEIILLGATPEELAGLTVALASADTFDRYGIDRPFYLQELVFDIVRSGQADGNVIRVRSPQPITEPFLTFLVEATWSRGRLLREYTVLLDPPTFAPQPDAQSQPAMTAPQRSTQTDSGRIDRTPAPPPQQSATSSPAPSRSAPSPQQSATSSPAPTRPAPQPKPEPVADNTPYDTSGGGDYIVQRGETLWGIASAIRPDSRLSMNQTMLAIYEANPQAFQNNINILSAGAALNMPSADDIYRIDRRDASSEVQRQHSAWGDYVPPVSTSIEPDYADPDDGVDTRPSLILVPADDDTLGVDTGIDSGIDDAYAEPVTREQEFVDRIAELEGAEVPIQQSLIEIRNNELAALRQELANIRGEVYEPFVDTTTDDAIVGGDADEIYADDSPADDSLASDELFPDLAEDGAGDEATDDAAADAADSTPSQGPGSILIDDSPSLVDQALGLIMSKVGAIVAGVMLLVGGLLFWFMRRGDEDDDDSGVWNALDSDEIRMDPLDSTESIQAPHHDESIVVVEQESGIRPLDDTFEAESPLAEPSIDVSEATGQFGSLEDTFSSETAVNLDQSDPVAEADFHMAYGLYDQAADLINGALQVEPERQDLLTKLCEIYFVWGNRDAFVDAAQRLKGVTGGGDNEDWNKIVIMGQQIAADDTLFAGAGVAGATKEVDLSFEADAEDTGALDMDFGDDAGSVDIIDLGASDGTSNDGDGVDFLFDEEATELEDTSATSASSADFSVTAEMPTIETRASENTVETPTIEEQFAGLDATSELPSIDENALDSAIEESGQASDATAEINLDDLDLSIDGLAETELASLDDLVDLDATGTNEALAADDLIDVTGKNPQVDPDATGVQTALNPDATGMSESLKVDDELAENDEMRLADDETGQNPMVDSVESGEVASDIDESLLDATGHTQILSEDLAVATAAEEAGDLADSAATMMAQGLGDDQETMLASLDDDADEGDFDFAKTEALPPEVFTGSTNLDETGELPAVASTDVDLDLDDLTAALKVSEAGDTVEQPRDDATVEQPRPAVPGEDASATMELGADDMSDDLQEARTMTEVGTKLDLARAYVDMGDPAGARSILDEVLDEGDESQRQQAQQLLDSLPS